MLGAAVVEGSVETAGPVVVSASPVVVSSVTFSEGVVEAASVAVLTASVIVDPSVCAEVASSVTPVLGAGVVEASVDSVVFGTVLTSGVSLETASVTSVVGVVVASGVTAVSSVVFGVVSLASYAVVPSVSAGVEDTDGPVVASASCVVIAAAVVGASGEVVEVTVGDVEVSSSVGVVTPSVVATVVAASGVAAEVEMAGCDSVVCGPSSSRGPSAVVGFSVDGTSLLGVTGSVVASDLAVVSGVVCSVTVGFVVASAVVLKASVDASDTEGSVVSFAPKVGAVAVVTSGATVVGHS